MALKNKVEKIVMDCPLCDKVHEVEKRYRITNTVIKNDEVTYLEDYYLCVNSDEDMCEFVTSEMMESNLMNARNSYRKKHELLTSDEIVNIRSNFGMSQIDLAKLFSWGEATISRYESKSIQDVAYDNDLKLIRDNPLIAYKMLVTNRNKYDSAKYKQICAKVIECINDVGNEYLSRQVLEGEYASFSERTDNNGFTLLDIDKLEAVVSYFAAKISNLYKVKLMKLLWYADSLCYKENNRTITGLVYCHETMGALPIGHYSIGGLHKVNMVEEYKDDYIAYHFFESDLISYRCLSKDEIIILNKVIAKFGEYTSSEIIEYMYKEKAYIDTNDKEIIPFSLAKEIRNF